MIHLEQVLVVEGRYDRNKVSQIFDATVIETEGFGIFKQPHKLELLRKLAQTRGLIVLTDGDGAGFLIRNYLKSAIPQGNLFHAYIPDLYGKERRKSAPSKEGKLGVEGVPDAVLIEAVRRSGVPIEDTVPHPRGNLLTKQDLFALGLSGRPESKQRRAAVIQALNLPEHLSTNGFLDALNLISNRYALESLLEDLAHQNTEKG